MTINLATKYEKKLDERFTQGSLTDRWTSKAYDFDGTNAIKVWTLGQANINNYTTSPSAGNTRFGAYHEVQDEVNTYTLTNKKSFNETFDITNVADQMFVKKANAFLKQVWDEQFVPDIDMDRFTAWANGAGLGVVNGTALTKSTVIEAMLTANAALNNSRVPRSNRAFFVNETLCIKFRLADELKNNESFTTKAIINGQIGSLAGYPVIAVPDDLLPAGINFMMKYKNASLDPMKLKMLRVITDSEMVAGSVMQGLVRYDSFVLAQKANGIYVHAASGVSTISGDFGTTASTKVTLTGSAGTTVYYTEDGSNPKTSPTKSTYSAAFVPTNGTTLVRAYATKSGQIDSAIIDIPTV